MTAPRVRRICICVLVGCGVLALVRVAMSQEAEPPKFQGDRLQEPPEQKKGWTPPKTTLPVAFVVATKTLFDFGMADPRGCEYRNISFAAGGKSTLRGWVLPSDGKSAQRFAIGWNGLVYPIGEVGANADLKADIQRAIKEDKAARANEKKGEPVWDMIRSNPTSAIYEYTALSHETILPVKACLLLRVGEEKLARDLWMDWTDRIEKINNSDEYIAKPYIVLAENWSWYAFDRALGAHMRGDDRLALLAARQLVPIEEPLLKAAATLGAQRYTTEGVRGRVRKDGVRQFETFQGQVERPLFVMPHDDLPALHLDQERRAKKVAQKPGVGAQDKSGRIAALIRDLEEVQVLQMSQPGYPDFRESETVKKLIEQGEDAVPALIDVIESDNRLTRSVSYSRNFSTDRHIIGVYEPAYSALTAILRTGQLELPDGEGAELTHRQKIAAAARDYWKKNKGVPLEQRWFRTLADEKATPDQWLEAASRITRIDADSAGGEAKKMDVESLRSKQKPSVAELMARRVEQIADSNKNAEPPSLLPATRMALCLAKWDPPASLPTLKAHTARCQAKVEEGARAEDGPGHFWPHEGPTSLVAEVVVARVRAGDKDALREYGKWLPFVPVKAVGFSAAGIFEPIWRYAEDPAMVSLSTWIFNDPQSPWPALFGKLDHSVRESINSPLLGSQGFRDRISILLTDTAVAGTVELTAGETKKVSGDEVRTFPSLSIEIKTENGQSSYGGGYDTDDPLAKPGHKTDFRRCDYYAWELSKVDGFPNFGVYWPEAERDKGIAAISAFLKLHANQLIYRDDTPKSRFDTDHRRAELNFPKLDHPATPEEVAKGLAIFSLGTRSDARVVALPTRPRHAEWNNPKKKDKEHRPVWGFVWQAEEVQENGKSQLYYGFVGGNMCQKVRAEEVELKNADGSE